MKKEKKKKINKSKGFSMIELLAVVVILGVVSTIGIVSVTRLLEKSKEHYYETQRDQMVLAARAYAGDHKEILPKDIGKKEKITLKTLYEKNYLKDKIEDKNKGKCYAEPTVKDGKTIKGSRVEVTKTSQSEYVYVGYLECDACKEEKDDNTVSCYDKTTEEEPFIKIDLDPVPSNKIMDKSKEIKLTLKGNETDTNILVASYSYKIYVNNVLKYSSGLKVNNKKPTVEVKDQLYKYVPGKIKVVASVTNNKGITKTLSKSENYEDAMAPLCGRVKYDQKNPMMTDYDHKLKNPDDLKCGSSAYQWINISTPLKSRHVWVVCDDELGLGCAQTEFSKLFTTNGENEDIVLKDVNGHSVACSTKKCIDRTSIKITVNIKNGDNVKKTFTIDPQQTTLDYKPTAKYDTWLNKANYPNGVTVEVIVNDGTNNKDDSSLIKNFSWYQNPKEKKESQVTHTTSASEKLYDEKDKANRAECKGIANMVKEKCKNYKYTKTITEDGVRREVITVEDYAGNKVTYSLILKIDRTPPTVPTVTGYKKTSNTNLSNSNGLNGYTYNKWYNKYELNKASGSVDKPDVSGFNKYQYTAWGATTKSTDTDGTYRNINAEGTSKIKYRACDVAGNCSAYSGDKIVLLDHTDPTCNVYEKDGTKGDNGWYRGGSPKAYTNCKDQANLSGCDPDYSVLHIHTVNYNTAGQTDSRTIKDIAGNTKSCSHTFKYDKSSPSCSIGSNGWTEGSVTLKTSCSDSGPSGVASCKGNYATTTTGKHTHNVKDKAGNTSSCSTTVSSKRQKKSCTACDDCKAAGCKTANTCTKKCCGQTCSAIICHGQNCDVSPRTVKSCETYTSPADTCSCKNKKCTDEDCCGCKTYKTNCSKCGCATWGSWTDVGSCSESTTATSKTQCRTMYKNS